MRKGKKALTYSLCEDANGWLYVSKRPMNPKYYGVVAKLKCIPSKAKKLTKSGVFPGSIGITIADEVVKIVEVKQFDGIERTYLTFGSL